MLKKFATGILTLLIAALPLSGVAKADTIAANLLPNPSLETSTNGTAPDSWSTSNYSTVANGNDATFTYLNTGHTGTRSLEVQVTKYTDGSANWYTGEVPVTAGTTYQFSDWYQANIDTEIDAEVTVGGVVSYYKVGTAFASPGVWANYTTTFTAPAGATSMSLYHLIGGVGTLITDDYSLGAYTPSAFTKPIISVTFDDGWANQFTNAEPVLQANGIPGTFYIISDEVQNTTPVDGSAYMDQTQVKNLFAAGNEIGSHTIDHCELTTGLTEPGGTACPGFNLNNEMSQSKSTLEGLVGTGKVTDFAYPYGSYNATTIAAGKPYYQSQRSVNAGYNTKDSLDVTQLKMYEVDSNITPAQVQAWVDGAIAEHAWLILTYHEIANTAAQGDEGYNATPADFATEMAYIHSKAGVANVETVAQALAEIQTQLTTPPVVKPGDVNADGLVNDDDATIMFANWGTVPGGVTTNAYDLDHNGVINDDDATIMFANWSK